MAAKYSLDDIIEKADDEESRKELIETATQFVLKTKFDGLDLVFDFSKEKYYNEIYRFLSLYSPFVIPLFP